MSTPAPLPEPLVPPEVDLRDFPFMPLDVRRLLTSETWIEGSDDAKPAHAALSLWCECWHQIPAASLPDNDKVLARLAMCDLKTWQRIREQALRGFVRCSDGRLYHRVVAEKALEAWQRKLAQRERTAKATEARRKRNVGVEANEALSDDRSNVDRYDRRDDRRDDDRNEQRHGQRDDRRDDHRNVHQGTETETETEKERDSLAAAESDAPRASARDPAAADAVAMIEAFDEVRVEVFGAEQRRPWPAEHDRITAKRWLDAGAALDLARGVFATQMARMKAKRREPPRSLAIFEQDIANAVAAAAQPMPEPATIRVAAPDADFDPERTRWRFRVQRWLADPKSWLTQWGYEPNDRSTMVPAAVLAEFGISPAQAQAAAGNA
jgi:hypothetical protein